MSTSHSGGRAVSPVLFCVSILLVLLAWAATPLLVFLLGGRATILFQFNPVAFLPLAGALLGGTLALLTLSWPPRRYSLFEPWSGTERWGWQLIGTGMLLWSLGESYRLYTLSLGREAFPSLADAGYGAFLLLLFVGIMLLPGSTTGVRRALLLLDILIWTGPVLLMTLPFYVGTVTRPLATLDAASALRLYYLVAEVLLFACVVLLLLRSPGKDYQASARRPLPFLMGLSLCLLVASDFILHIYPVASTPLDLPWPGRVLVPWHEVGWLLALLLLGLVATLRRFIPVTPPERLEQRVRRRRMRAIFGPIQFAPYIPLIIYLLLSVINLVLYPPDLRAIIGVALLLAIILLLVLRQLLTLMENGRLIRVQKDAFEQNDLEKRQREMEYRMVESRMHVFEQRNQELLSGISHMKEVLTRMANGDLRIRSRITDGELLPLSTSLNLMADRVAYQEQHMGYAQHLIKTLNDLSASIEEYRMGAVNHIEVPAACRDIAQLDRLVLALGLKYHSANALPTLSDEQGTVTMSTSVLPDPAAQQMRSAVEDLAAAIEFYRASGTFSFSPNDASTPEMQHLLTALGLPIPVDAPPVPARPGPPVPEEPRQPRRPRIQPLEMNEGQ